MHQILQYDLPGINGNIDAFHGIGGHVPYGFFFNSQLKQTM